MLALSTVSIGILLALMGLFVLSVAIIVIVKIANYINGKGLTTERKLSRKLLGIEFGSIIVCAIIYLASMFF